MTRSRPPVLATFLLRLAPRARQQPEIEADLIELFRLRTAQGGPRYASRRFWADVFSLCIQPSARINLPADAAGGRSPVMERITLDLRYALRQLIANPGFAAAAVLTLALGIGGSTAIFSAVDAVVLQALPYPEADRLVIVWERAPNGRRNSASPGTFGDWAGETGIFEQVAARRGVSFVLTGGEAPVLVPGALVTAAYFDVFGIRPSSGRTFTPDDAADGTAVVVTSRFEREHFGTTSAVGRTLRLDGQAHVVVGVLPEGSFDRGTTAMFRAITFPREDRRFHFLAVYARLRDGITVTEAQSRLEVLAGQTAANHPVTNRDWSVVVDPLRDQVIGPALRQTVLLLFAGAAIVLLIACANVASLTLARSMSRAREVAVRAALGAGRLRIAGQFLTESVVVGVAGGLVGVLAAYWAVRGLAAVLPAGLLPAETALAVDPRVLAFALGASLFAGLMCGLLPAVRAGRHDVAGAVRGGTQRSTAGRVERRFGDVLVAGEIAVTVTLIVSAWLLVATITSLERVDPGFDADGVLTWRVNVPAVPGADGDAQAARITTFLTSALDAISALPGVSSAAVVTDLPVADGWSFGVRYRPEMAPEDAAGRAQTFAHGQRISAGFFETLGIPIVKGRGLTRFDDEGAERVIVINETLARRAFEGADPIGRQLYLSTGQAADEPWRVVGIAGDVKVNSLAEPDASSAEVYLPFAQGPLGTTAFVLRSAGPPMALARAVREVFRDLDPDIPVTRLRPLDDLIDSSVAVERFRARLVGVFAALGLVLAAVGIYGVRAHAVERRRREVGIRIALGAARREILWLVVGQGAVLAAAGLAVGGAGALLAGRAMSALLFQVRAGDPAILTGGVLVVIATVVLASYLPARHAAGVDPASVLRMD